MTAMTTELFGPSRPSRRPAAVTPSRTTPPRVVDAGRPGVTEPGLRLTLRGRVVVAVLALVAALAWTLASQQAVAGQAGEAIPVSSVTVAAGETLWDIARTYTEPGQDVREVVDRLVDLNGLAGGSLQAGQELLVPAP
jgi:LysM repeat protein